MCLLIGLFLFISCGSNDSGEDDKVLTKQYLSLKSYGLTDFKVTNYSEEETFSLGIKRIGGTFATELSAKLETWSKEELEAYNKRRKLLIFFYQRRFTRYLKMYLLLREQMKLRSRLKLIQQKFFLNKKIC